MKGLSSNQIMRWAPILMHVLMHDLFCRMFDACKLDSNMLLTSLQVLRDQMLPPSCYSSQPACQVGCMHMTPADHMHS